jgi:ubiquinone/menaquinone biosynthesis C-methylase UbiE
MSNRLTDEQIKDFWSQQAIEHGESPSASWSDHRVIDMEIAQITKYLKDGDEVLDVGCANGFSTINFALRKSIRIHGVDYIPEMIDTAKARLTSLEPATRERMSFDVGDAANLQLPDGQYDKVTVVRVIINLGEWSNQLKGILECARMLKKDGLLLMSEATVQGWRRLNALRAEWKLDEIPMPGFNNYLDENQVVEAVQGQLEVVEIVNFASSYFVGTRIIKPLLARAASLDIDVADPNMEWNRWCSQIPAAGDYGTQKLFVFRKR